MLLESVTEWGSESGVIVHAEMECETEPDIDSDEWPDWHAEHHNMPYVHWMPYGLRALKWLRDRYRYDGSKLIDAPPPFPGRWKKREEIEGGLDAAKSLGDIAYFSETRGDAYGWNNGITSAQVQYWVRIQPEKTNDHN